MPTFQLATQDDLRAITTKNLEAIGALPHLYIPADAVNIQLPPLSIPTQGVELMRVWGVAAMPSLADYARLYPGALVAPASLGQFVDRGELIFNGAESAEAFLPGQHIG